jgi:hypothetical protein
MSVFCQIAVDATTPTSTAMERLALPSVKSLPATLLLNYSVGGTNTSLTGS